MSQLTAEQRQAIEARGNVLVVAGAGTGKTRTVVRRCVDWLLDQPGDHSLDQVLMVTFTDAAAAEMRQRIREELQARLDQVPDQAHIFEQLALLDSAFISTLHSFCLRLIRQHFYELDLDPQLTVLAAEEAELLAEETLSKILHQHYSGQTAQGEAVLRLIQEQARGQEIPIKRLVLRLHRYGQTLPDPAGWLEQQLARFRVVQPDHWREWLRQALVEWRQTWPLILQETGGSNLNVARCLEAMRDLRDDADLAQYHQALEIIQTAFENPWPHGSAGPIRDRLKEFFQDSAFLRELTGSSPLSEDVKETMEQVGAPPIDAASAEDPLAQDWSWVRMPMSALLELTREFGQAFTLAKRELGSVDFHDLEQFSLRLLWNSSQQCPTPLAKDWRHKLRLIFVDEYQDINAAQDLLLQALGSDGSEANRFLVGDPKQSIYRFRLADPHIFHHYLAAWRQPGQGQVVPLTFNFRAHETILKCINALFSSIMRQEIGGLAYDQDAQLLLGDAAQRQPFSAADQRQQNRPAPVEVHLSMTGTEVPEDDGLAETPESSEESVSSRTDAEHEARLIGLRLVQLRQQPFLIWNSLTNDRRPVQWRDMVILLRSPQRKAEAFAKEFHHLGIPLVAARGGYFESPEVTDLLGILSLLDNPLQDIPVLTVLRSPLVGLTLDELALIRLAAKGRFWKALQQFHRMAGPRAGMNLHGRAADPSDGWPAREKLRSFLDDPVHGQTAKSAWEKADLFLGRYGEWRRLARQRSLSECLERILIDTQYEAWLLARPPGQQRANVSKLLTWARQFDQFQRQGLFRFLAFVAAQKDAAIDRVPAPPDTEDAVRLMSIHQSKGLEFCVVVVADLGKLFNLVDLKSDVILDEKYGVCPLVKPPFTEQRYPSLPYWLAQRRQRQEILGEEMRLLYVAMTRACQLLLLTGSTTGSAAERWRSSKPGPRSIRDLLSARSCLDWLGPWLTEVIGGPDWADRTEGHCDLLHWKIHSNLKPDPTENIGAGRQDWARTSSLATLSPESLQALVERLAWRYPFEAATAQSAKRSVSALRQSIVDPDEPQPRFRRHQTHPETSASRDILTAAECGTAHHRFLQLVAVDALTDTQEIVHEADRLQAQGLLSPAERAALDLEAIAAFWQSKTGREIFAHRACLHREVSFTARLSLQDLHDFQARLGLRTELFPTADRSVPAIHSAKLEVDAMPRSAEADEFIICTGVVDLVVLLADEIWILDFKTDAVDAQAWPSKAQSYEPQLQLYALALGRIHDRPVTHCWLHSLALGCTVELAAKPMERS